MEEPKKKRILKSAPTMREHAEKARLKSDKPKNVRIRRVTGRAKKPIKALKGASTQEFYLPLPNFKFSNFLNKRRYIIPKYIKQSFEELKLVTWPGRRETWRLTSAVFIFAFIFGLIVALVDKGLETLFKNYILK